MSVFSKLLPASYKKLVYLHRTKVNRKHITSKFFNYNFCQFAKKFFSNLKNEKYTSPKIPFSKGDLQQFVSYTLCKIEQVKREYSWPRIKRQLLCTRSCRFLFGINSYRKSGQSAKDVSKELPELSHGFDVGLFAGRMDVFKGRTKRNHV